MSNVTSEENRKSRTPVTMADGARLQAHEILYAQVMLRQGDRVLLGNVVDLYEDRDELKAVVKHFNGEDWPLRPNVSLLTVLGAITAPQAEPTEPRHHGFYCPVRCWCDKADR